MIKKLTLKNFRNHQFLEIHFNKTFTYIDGLNGSGKTSILESVYFIATTKSHRTTDEKQLIKHGEPFAQVKIQTDKDVFEIIISKKGKHALINRIEKRKMSDFIGHLKVVMFAPEDMELIKGSPTERRHFLDLEIVQLNKQYLRSLTNYKNILKQRNSLLKKISINDDYTFLNILAEQLLESGLEIIDLRKQFIENLNIALKKNYARFSQHEVSIQYDPNVDEKSFKKALFSNQKQDILYQTTLSGPHRDDFYIAFNGFDAKHYASQGEQRLILIALKLALLEMIEAATNQDVVLLLDDVFSELDEEKQQIFLNHLPKKHQIIMNSTNPIQKNDIQGVHLEKEYGNDKL
jgi:DNA replication and repair protein RecF